MARWCVSVWCLEVCGTRILEEDFVAIRFTFSCSRADLRYTAIILDVHGSLGSLGTKRLPIRWVYLGWVFSVPERVAIESFRPSRIVILVDRVQ